MTCNRLRQKPLIFTLDHLVAFTGILFKPASVDHLDVSAPAPNEAVMLQFPGSFGNSFTASAQHCRNQFLRQDYLVRFLSIEYR